MRATRWARRLLVLVGFAAIVTLGDDGAAQSKVDQGRPGNQGPWPVSVAGGTVTVLVTADGGTTYVAPAQCSGMAHKVASIGVAAGNCPATQLANRRYVVLCNSLENVGTPTVKVRTDGTDPVTGVAAAGDVIGVGDCLQFDVSAATVPRCIATVAATAVHSYECVQ